MESWSKLSVATPSELSISVPSVVAPFLNVTVSRVVLQRAVDRVRVQSRRQRHRLTGSVPAGFAVRRLLRSILYCS